MAEDDIPEGAAPKAKGGLMPTILAVGVLTALAGGAGAVTGLLIGSGEAEKAAEAEAPAPTPAQAEGQAGEHAGAEAAAGEAADAAEAAPTRLLAMKPIITNIAAPANVVVRLESSVLLKGETEETPELIMARIEADTATFLRTVQLPQLEGARGITHLREDLVERARMRSPAVADVLIQSLVAE